MHAQYFSFTTTHAQMKRINLSEIARARRKPSIDSSPASSKRLHASQSVTSIPYVVLGSVVNKLFLQSTET